MSVNVILELQSTPENIVELKATFEKILPDSRSYAGCISINVISNQDDPSNIILLETWESRGHYDTYLAWRTETGALDALVSLLSQPPSIRYFNDLSI